MQPCCVSTTVSLAGLSDVPGTENSVSVANAPKIIHTLSTHTSSMLRSHCIGHLLSNICSVCTHESEHLYLVQACKKSITVPVVLTNVGVAVF